MENIELKFINRWANKRKQGKIAYMFSTSVLYSLIGMILWLAAEWCLKGRYYFQNQILQRWIYVSMPPWITFIIVSIISSLKRFDENERKYLAYLARYKFEEQK